jgi:hypothetical protein
MDKPGGFRHEKMDQVGDSFACRPIKRESLTISMAFSDFLNAGLAAAERAPRLGEDRC